MQQIFVIFLSDQIPNKISSEKLLKAFETFKFKYIWSFYILRCSNSNNFFTFRLTQHLKISIYFKPASL